jgi:aspartyl-tRNA(Asn)/glutamyl-tRNA(Gln) amidotransferase subunit A
MVIAVKDVLSVKDKLTTCASKILGNFHALYTCTAVQRLIDEDAIVIGKTNCDEFAMGSSNENSAFGPVRNPHDESRVPGGSSGGSAVAVAADMCMASLGTDTGGSVRQPAALCGVVGLKPTYGRVSRSGLTAFASSFDTIAPFSGNIDDVALVLEVMSGWDKMDSTSVKAPVPKYSEELKKELSSRDIKIGIVKEYMGEGLQAEIKQAVLNAAEFLRKQGFVVLDVDLPHAKYSIQTYYILTTAEASSNLARYDGARYGKRSDSSATLEDLYVNSRSEGFGTEVKRRIMLGTYVLSHGYYEAYYRKAQKVRRLIRQDFEKAFQSVDLILSPSTPTTAFKIGEKIDDPLAMYLNDIYTTVSNLAGNPSVSIPIGKDNQSLPIGLQIIGKYFEELNIMKLARYLHRNYLSA